MKPYQRLIELIGDIEGRLKQMTKFKLLPPEKLAYLAGFLDGDGSVNAQLVKRLDYRLGYQIRVSVTFFQKSTRHWFLMKIKDEFGVNGTLRYRDDGVSELAVVGVNFVKPFLETIQPYVLIKQKQTRLVLDICNNLSKNQLPEDFIKLCKKVDLLEDLNDSKKTKIRAVDVEAYLTG